jgi:signal peptidase
MAVLIAAFSIYGSLSLSAKIPQYSYWIPPLFWALLAGYCLLKRQKKHAKANIRSSILIWSIIAGIFTIALLYLSGIVDGFARSFYSRTFSGLALNLFAFGVALLCNELVRSYMLTGFRSQRRYTKLICVITCIAFIVSALNFRGFLAGLSTPLGMFEKLAGELMPAVMLSVFLTYCSFYSNAKSCILFRVITELPLYLLPIVPNSRWITTAMIKTIVPFIVMLVISYDIGLISRKISRRELRKESPVKWIALFSCLTVFMLFIVGFLPWQPVSVATGSMEPVIMTGDMVIVNKLAKSEVKVGDVVQYQLNSYTVIHRILSISKDDKNNLIYITQGDNNNAPDPKPVSQAQILGRVDLTVPKVGWLTLWMHSQNTDKETVEVATGDK